MAKKVRVELVSSGIQSILKSQGVSDALMSQARKRTPSMEGYEAVQGSGGKRAHAFIGAMTWDAYEDNARNATLLNALGGSDSSGKMVKYTTKAGKTRLASQAQVDNWTRGSR